LGKIDWEDQVFDNGYSMGFQNLNVYTEFWNPASQYIPYAGAGPIPQDSAFVHLVSTYSAITGKLSDYVNGELSGETQMFPPNPIAGNDAQFLIGAAPWGPESYQFYGAMDEIRVWNVAHTAEEIQQYMHKELRGDEEGLVAYYNFNDAHDSIVPDAGPLGNTGTLQNPDDDCWWWADSYVPVGDSAMYELLDIDAAWCGKAGDEFYQVITENGFSVITDIQALEFEKYMVFARTDEHGKTTEFSPDGAPESFERAARQWYLNKGGNITADLFFNLEQAAGDGEALPSGGDKTSYVLLHRANLESNYAALSYPDQVFNENLIFNDIELTDGYYCVGYSSTPFNLSIEEELLKNISFGPNPAKESIMIKNAEGTTMAIRDITGRIVMETPLFSNYQQLNIEQLNGGLYFATFTKEDTSVTYKIIIQN